MNNMFKSSIVLTAAKFFSMVLEMIVVMILARILLLKEYGTYSQIIVFITLISAIFSMGLPSCTNYFLASANDRKDQRDFLTSFFFLCNTIGLVTAVVVWLCGSYIAGFFNNEQLAAYIIPMAILPWTKMTTGSVINIFIALDKLQAVIWYWIVHSVVSLLIVLFIFVYKLSMATYINIVVVSELLFSLAIIFQTNSYIQGIKVLDCHVDIIKKICCFALPLGLATMVGTISIGLDKVIISWFYDIEIVGIYSNAARELPVTFLSASITAVIMPQMVRLFKAGKKHDAIALWGGSIELSYIVICFCAFALFVFAPEVITFLYSDKFLSGVAVFRIYAIVLLLRITYFATILNSTGKTQFIFYCSVASLVLNCVLNYMFVLAFGITGSAIATLVSLWASALLQIIATCRFQNIALAAIFPWKRLLEVTALNGLLAIIFFTIKMVIPLASYCGNVLEAIILGLIWMGLYFFITAKDIKKCKNFLQNLSGGTVKE